MCRLNRNEVLRFAQDDRKGGAHQNLVSPARWQRVKWPGAISRRPAPRPGSAPRRGGSADGSSSRTAVGRARHLAAQDAVGGAHARIGDRHGAHQRRRVGMLRLAEDRVGRRQLDQLADIHHGDAVGDVAHHRQVVGDEQEGRASAAPAARAAGSAPAPGSRHRAPRPARRPRPGAGWSRARGRCRCAGAGRRRRRAGSGA